MITYLAASYTNVPDRERHMRDFCKFAGRYMEENPGKHIVSPLYHHYTLKQVPTMGHDYNYWREYSRDLLSRCDAMIILMEHDWETSTGVQDEITYAMQLHIPIYYFNIHDFNDPS